MVMMMVDMVRVTGTATLMPLTPMVGLLQPWWLLLAVAVPVWLLSCFCRTFVAVGVAVWLLGQSCRMLVPVAVGVEHQVAVAMPLTESCRMLLVSALFIKCRRPRLCVSAPGVLLKQASRMRMAAAVLLTHPCRMMVVLRRTATSCCLLPRRPLLMGHMLVMTHLGSSHALMGCMAGHVIASK